MKGTVITLPLSCYTQALSLKNLNYWLKGTVWFSPNALRKTVPLKPSLSLMFVSLCPCQQCIVFLKKTSSSHIELRISWTGLPCVLNVLKTGNGTFCVVEGLASSAAGLRRIQPCSPHPRAAAGELVEGRRLMTKGQICQTSLRWNDLGFCSGHETLPRRKTSLHKLSTWWKTFLGMLENVDY